MYSNIIDTRFSQTNIRKSQKSTLRGSYIYSAFDRVGYDSTVSVPARKTLFQGRNLNPFWPATGHMRASGHKGRLNEI